MSRRGDNKEILPPSLSLLVTRKMFLSAVESVTDSTELGRQLGLTETALNSLHNEGTQKSNVYGQMYEVSELMCDIV